MGVHTEKFQFFNVKYHLIIEIVECESGRVAKKWILAHSLEICNENGAVFPANRFSSSKNEIVICQKKNLSNTTIEAIIL